MGLMDTFLGLIFGGERNVVREYVEVFRENAEGAAVRQSRLSSDALEQFAAEFTLQERGLFDRAIDGINRLPRPALAFGTIGLFVAALWDPIWFAGRMQGLALVPDPLWWLLGAIVSFYFGARHQSKSQSFRRSMAAIAALAPTVASNIAEMRDLAGQANVDLTGPNQALQDWKQSRGK